jgi:hypothetical protein
MLFFKYNFEAIYEATKVSKRANGKTTNRVDHSARNIFAVATQYNTKTNDQDITPLKTIAFLVLPKTWAHNQNRNTYKAVSKTSQNP